jgi:hypothetical protein
MNIFSRLIFEIVSVQQSSVVEKRTGAASKQAVNSPSPGYPCWLSHMHVRTHTCRLQTPPPSISPSGPGCLLYTPFQGLVNCWWRNHPGKDFSIFHGCMLRPSMMSKNSQFMSTLKLSKGISGVTCSCRPPREKHMVNFCPVQAQFKAL